MDKINPDCLIAAVYSRPVLWKENHKDYKNKSITDKHWNEVGEFCNCLGVAAKSKWKNLKDTFRRVNQKYTRASSGNEMQPMHVKWQYYEIMSFLKDTSAPNPTQANLQEPQEFAFAQNCSAFIISEILSDDETNTVPNAIIPSTSCSNNITKKKSIKRKQKIKFDPEFLDIEQEESPPNILKQKVENNDEDYDDMLFFKSLAPFMAKFNDVEKLEIRGEIQNIILDKLKKKAINNYEYLP